MTFKTYFNKFFFLIKAFVLLIPEVIKCALYTVIMGLFSGEQT